MTDPDEAQWLIDAAADEIGARSDTHEEVRSFVADTAGEIACGSITPYEGARKIWAAAHLVSGQHAYDAFIYAVSEYEDRPEDRELFEDAILREARRFAGGR